MPQVTNTPKVIPPKPRTPTPKMVAVSGDDLSGKKKRRRRRKSLSGIRSSNPAIAKIIDVALANGAGIATAAGSRMMVNSVSKGNKSTKAMMHIATIALGTMYEAFAKGTQKPMLQKAVNGAVIGSGLALAQDWGKALGVTTLAGDENGYLLAEDPISAEIADNAIAAYNESVELDSIEGYDVLESDFIEDMTGEDYDFDGYMALGDEYPFDSEDFQ